MTLLPVYVAGHNLVIKRGKIMKPGDKAPDFILTDCYGNEVNSVNLRGKKIWLYFFTSPGGGN